MARKEAEEMYPIVEEYLEGNEPVDAICRRYSLSTSMFYYWHRKYNRAHKLSSESKFVSLDFSASGSFRYELELPNGVKLRSVQIFSPSYISELIRTGC